MMEKVIDEAARLLDIHYAEFKTKFGTVMLAATERGICFLQFRDGDVTLPKQLQNEFPGATISRVPEASKPLFQKWIAALHSYLAGESTLESLPLDVRGTAFQVLVWRYLQTIPAGDVQSYSDVAKAIGKPKAFRAVASACARNRIALIVPCHRVIHGDGNISGYRWGVSVKRALLALEKVPV